MLKNVTANHEGTEMSFAPLLDATHPIAVHGISALICLILGLAQLLMRKGTTLHRRLGWVWAVLMALVAISGLFIWELRLFWLFSPIHLLSLLTLWALARGILAARQGRIADHKRAMKQLYGLALVISGAFTVFPGRIMYLVLFGTH
ncbi:MAG: putative membrane protein [Planktomarina sp.]